MKLQGIILPASVAVSTPIIVPVGALGGTVKLLIVIVINLSGDAISLLNECLTPFPGAQKRSVGPHLLISQAIIHHINNLNISNIAQPDADASVTQGGRCTDALVSPDITDAAVESAISSAAVSAVDETLRHLPPDLRGRHWAVRS